MIAGAGGGAGTGLPPLDGPAPTLPAIVGECPTFTDGQTISVAGHGSVLILAGAPGMGGPLLFYWHGTGGSATEATRTLPAAVRSEIIAAGGIIASFNGRESAGTEGDCSGTSAHNMADFKAADQIAACAVQNHGIDPRRIYTTGCSAGGLQLGCMAMKRSSYIAAAAPNSGGIVFPQQWEDASTPAIFTMHGGPSDMVIVTFSQTSMTLDSNAKTHGSFVVNCNHGGGHCRASAELQTAAWQFMKDHPWGFTPPSPWVATIPANVPDYCAVF
jgi:poly(3-hydroxybutyrate) depolymerase